MAFIRKKADDICLDFDGREEYHQFIHRLFYMRWKFSHFIKIQNIWCYDTAHGKHIILRLKEPLPNKPAMVAMQAILGSDFRRELYNLYHVTKREDTFGDSWNVLFTHKYLGDEKGIHLNSSEKLNRKETTRLRLMWKTGRRIPKSVIEWLVELL